jgi:hypothetical protein
MPELRRDLAVGVQENPPLDEAVKRRRLSRCATRSARGYLEESCASHFSGV